MISYLKKFKETPGVKIKRSLLISVYGDVKGKHYKRLIGLLPRECNRFAFVENRGLIELEDEKLAYIDDIIADISKHLI